VVIRRAEPVEISWITGDDDSATCFDNDGHDVGINDHGGIRSRTCQYPTDDASQVPIGVPAGQRFLFPRKASVYQLIVTPSSVELGEHEGRYEDIPAESLSGLKNPPDLPLSR
jgi:hypothetical protein